jgi:hypothetical protein
MEVLGVGKLLEIRDRKWDEVAERLTMELELDKWGNSTKKGMNYVLCKVLLIVVDPVFTSYSGHDTAKQATDGQCEIDDILVLAIGANY